MPTTKEVQNWKAMEWQTRVSYIKPSAGGAIGVLFVWVWPKNGNGDSSNSTADFVIKPLQGFAAPTKFSEHVLPRMANANSLNSKPISKTSAEGGALL